MALPLGALLGATALSSLLGAGASSFLGNKASKQQAKLAEEQRLFTEALEAQRLEQQTERDIKGREHERKLAGETRAHEKELSDKSLAQQRKLESDKLLRERELQRASNVVKRAEILAQRSSRGTQARQAAAAANRFRGAQLAQRDIEARPLESFQDITRSVLDEGK